MDGNLSLTLRCLPQHGVDFARIVAAVVNDTRHYSAFLSPPRRPAPLHTEGRLDEHAQARRAG